ncbi:conserved hypothetical protein [Rubrivivax sp. A210]|uniref:DUF2726 domain-containing protein n=1 Tax=Rubrivivax sp. A210 TaxID=2772301 RepID=UPI0019187C2A|nr:DUF2726 domain-containing protein [Rubrivivax sp. A210]CAD5374166.1 conserved hypothetical protein [Rubrivivax sp. A210]
MEALTPIATFALPATVLLLLTLLGMRLRQRQQVRRDNVRDALDTVADWPPEAVRALTISERQGYEVLRRAMPGFLVLSQVPLSRFIRVPSRHSHIEWLQRVGSLSADLLLCDSGSRVLAVFDIRSMDETPRARRRHERMARVLKAAGIQVHVWREGYLPSASDLRQHLAHIVGTPAVGIKPASSVNSRPMPLIPVPDISEVLADGDRAAFEANFDATMEPVPSAFFEELESPAGGH